MRKRLIPAAVLLLAVPALAEQVENPAYKHWAKYKPGTSVTMQTQSEMKMPAEAGGAAGEAQKMAMTMTQKLVEVTPEKAVVEVAMAMEYQGMKQEMPARKQEIPAKINQENVDVPPMPPGMKAKVKHVKDGKDTVEVKGKKHSVTTKEMTLEIEGAGDKPSEAHTKVWTTPDVPGGTVKVHTKTQKPMEMTMEMKLVDYTIVK